MDSQEKLERAHKAKTLLDNEFFNECFDRLEAAYIQAWRNSLTVELREDAHRYVTLIGWLKQDLRSIATTGALEEARLAARVGPDVWPLKTPYGVRK